MFSMKEKAKMISEAIKTEKVRKEVLRKKSSDLVIEKLAAHCEGIAGSMAKAIYDNSEDIIRFILNTTPYDHCKFVDVKMEFLSSNTNVFRVEHEEGKSELNLVIVFNGDLSPCNGEEIIDAKRRIFKLISEYFDDKAEICDESVSPWLKIPFL